uniref:Zinc-finger domain-containing protein n=1 Tax=Haptolina brevifila TaxID=156173 RepID=A0A7S2GE71_9EUKA|mmetsp:Transcript_32746/g.65176  ORF Transcript_32746/g.65176 Transcript_32746/m.65176 type:complete len:1834 (+) Transcript_32746:42-5543(+)
MAPSAWRDVVHPSLLVQLDSDDELLDAPSVGTAAAASRPAALRPAPAAQARATRHMQLINAQSQPTGRAGAATSAISSSSRGKAPVVSQRAAPASVGGLMRKGTTSAPSTSGQKVAASASAAISQKAVSTVPALSRKRPLQQPPKGADAVQQRVAKQQQLVRAVQSRSVLVSAPATTTQHLPLNVSQLDGFTVPLLPGQVERVILALRQTGVLPPLADEVWLRVHAAIAAIATEKPLLPAGASVPTSSASLSCASSVATTPSSAPFAPCNAVISSTVAIVPAAAPPARGVEGPQSVAPPLQSPPLDMAAQPALNDAPLPGTTATTATTAAPPRGSPVLVAPATLPESAAAAAKETLLRTISLIEAQASQPLGHELQCALSDCERARRFTAWAVAPPEPSTLAAAASSSASAADGCEATAARPPSVVCQASRTRRSDGVAWWSAVLESDSEDGGSASDEDQADGSRWSALAHDAVDESLLSVIADPNSYQSPLLSLRAYRLSPGYLDRGVSARLTSAHGRARLQPDHPLCRFELRGACRAADCTGQHQRHFLTPPEQMPIELSRYAAGLPRPAAAAPVIPAASEPLETMARQAAAQAASAHRVNGTVEEAPFVRLAAQHYLSRKRQTGGQSGGGQDGGQAARAAESASAAVPPPTTAAGSSSTGAPVAAPAASAGSSSRVGCQRSGSVQLLHAALRLHNQPSLLAADLAKQLLPTLSRHSRTDVAALESAVIDGAPLAHEARRAPIQALPPTVSLPTPTAAEAAAEALFVEEARGAANGHQLAGTRYWQVDGQNGVAADDGTLAAELKELGAFACWRRVVALRLGGDARAAGKDARRSALRVLSRVLEAQPRSTALWVAHLSVFAIDASAAELRDVINEALRRSPISGLLWAKLASLQPTTSQRLATRVRALYTLCDEVSKGACAALALLPAAFSLLRDLTDSMQTVAAEHAAAILLAHDQEALARARDGGADRLSSLPPIPRIASLLPPRLLAALWLARVELRACGALHGSIAAAEELAALESHRAAATATSAASPEERLLADVETVGFSGGTLAWTTLHVASLAEKAPSLRGLFDDALDAPGLQPISPNEAAASPELRTLAEAHAFDVWLLRLNLVSMELALGQCDAANAACQRFLQDDFSCGGARCERIWRLWGQVQHARALAASEGEQALANPEALLWRARLSEIARPGEAQVDMGPAGKKGRRQQSRSESPRPSQRDRRQRKRPADSSPLEEGEVVDDSSSIDGDDGGSDGHGNGDRDDDGFDSGDHGHDGTGMPGHLLGRPAAALTQRFEQWHALVLAGSHSRNTALQLIACAVSERTPPPAVLEDAEPTMPDTHTQATARPGPVDFQEHARAVWHWCRPTEAQRSADAPGSPSANGAVAPDGAEAEAGAESPSELRALALRANEPSTALVKSCTLLFHGWLAASATWHSSTARGCGRERAYLHLLSVLWAALVGSAEEVVARFEAALHAVQSLPTPPACIACVWLRYLDWAQQPSSGRSTEQLHSLLGRFLGRTRTLPPLLLAPSLATLTLGRAHQPTTASAPSLATTAASVAFSATAVAAASDDPAASPRFASSAGGAVAATGPSADGVHAHKGAVAGDVEEMQDGAEDAEGSGAYDETVDVELLAILATEPARSFAHPGCWPRGAGGHGSNVAAYRGADLGHAVDGGATTRTATRTLAFGSPGGAWPVWTWDAAGSAVALHTCLDRRPSTSVGPRYSGMQLPVPACASPAALLLLAARAARDDASEQAFDYALTTLTSALLRDPANEDAWTLAIWIEASAGRWDSAATLAHIAVATHFQSGVLWRQACSFPGRPTLLTCSGPAPL